MRMQSAAFRSKRILSWLLVLLDIDDNKLSKKYLPLEKMRAFILKRDQALHNSKKKIGPSANDIYTDG